MRPSPKQKQSAFETKVLAMENGFNNFPAPNADLNFGKEVLTPAEVVQRFQGYISIIQDVQATQAAHQAAVKACERAMPAAHAFYDQAVEVVKAHFGSDPKVLATFGLGAPRKHSKVMPLVVIEEVILPAREGAGPIEPSEGDEGGSQADGAACAKHQPRGHGLPRPLRDERCRPKRGEHRRRGGSKGGKRRPRPCGDEGAER
jgi:hypothetical protein